MRQAIAGVRNWTWPRGAMVDDRPEWKYSGCLRASTLTIGSAVTAIKPVSHGEYEAIIKRACPQLTPEAVGSVASAHFKAVQTLHEVKFVTEYGLYSIDASWLRHWVATLPGHCTSALASEIGCGLYAARLRSVRARCVAFAAFSLCVLLPCQAHCRVTVPSACEQARDLASVLHSLRVYRAHRYVLVQRACQVRLPPL